MHEHKKKSVLKCLESMLLKGSTEHIGKRIGEKFWWDFSSFFSDIVCEKMLLENTYNQPYNELQALLYQLDPEQFERHEQPTGSKTIKRLSPDTHYTIIKRGLLISVSAKSYYSDNNGCDNKVEYTFLRMMGPNARRFHNFVISKLSTANTKNKIALFKQDMLRLGNKEMIDKISIYDVVIDTEVITKLIKSLYKWVYAKEFYQSHKLQYKLGILLYGQPGTGKSTLIRLIASILDSPVFDLDASNISSFLSSYMVIKQKTDRPVVVVIEDVDFFFQDREKNVGDSAQQHALFQVLDGLHSPSNVVFIATTNYIDKLDPALIRRFDLSLELKYWDKEKATIYAEKLGFTENDLKQLNIEYPVQPSMLKSQLLTLKLQR